MDVLKLNPFPSIAASSPFSLSTDELLGRTVLGLIFEQGGTFTKAQITDLEIVAGQKPVLPKIDGDNVQSLNDYDGLNDTSNYLFWWFGDPTARTIRGQYRGALDLSFYGDDPLQITGDIGAATSPTLQCYAVVGPPKMDMNIGFGEADAATSRVLVKTTVQPSAAVSRAAFPIGLGSEAGGRIRRMNFFHTNLTSVEYRKASDIKHENLSDALNDAIQNDFARSPQSGLYVVDRIVDGNQGDAETTLRNDGRPWPQQVMLTTSGSDTIEVYTDIHAPLALI